MAQGASSVANDISKGPHITVNAISDIAKRQQEMTANMLSDLLETGQSQIGDITL